MTRLLVVALLAAGCADQTAVPKTATELRIPFPEGWVAAGSSERLQAGPRGRAVVSFEAKPDAAPTLDVLLAAAAAQKATSVQGFDAPGFVAARYALDTQEAFVGVKTAGARTVWCASLHGATDAEVTEALNACRDLALR